MTAPVDAIVVFFALFGCVNGYIEVIRWLTFSRFGSPALRRALGNKKRGQ